ncbi:MAG: FAD-dependent thymidylate synthase, partial [Ilumatobacteraceae bacterium]
WVDYLRTRRTETERAVDELLGETPVPSVPEVSLTEYDADGEERLIAAICYPFSDLPDAELRRRVGEMPLEDRLALISAEVGDRGNRRHRPGRAFEATGYRFDVLSDYGAFRDLQRHRMMTVEWQRLTPNHGFLRPELVDEAGLSDLFDSTMARSADLFDLLREDFPQQASYAVSMAYRLRYSMQFNAREALHMLELRSSPQGHPSYRRVVLEMHRLIADQAGHHAIAGAMSHMTTEAPELERLESERRSEARRLSDG